MKATGSGHFCDTAMTDTLLSRELGNKINCKSRQFPAKETSKHLLCIGSFRQ